MNPARHTCPAPAGQAPILPPPVVVLPAEAAHDLLMACDTIGDHLLRATAPDHIGRHDYLFQVAWLRLRMQQQGHLPQDTDGDNLDDDEDLI